MTPTPDRTPDWQPIETLAGVEGEWVLLSSAWNPYFVGAAKSEGLYWLDWNDEEIDLSVATHWLPIQLPAPQERP